MMDFSDKPRRYGQTCLRCGRPILSCTCSKLDIDPTTYVAKMEPISQTEGVFIDKDQYDRLKDIVGHIVDLEIALEARLINDITPALSNLFSMARYDSEYVRIRTQEREEYDRLQALADLVPEFLECARIELGQTSYECTICFASAKKTDDKCTDPDCPTTKARALLEGGK